MIVKPIICIYNRAIRHLLPVVARFLVARCVITERATRWGIRSSVTFLLHIPRDHWRSEIIPARILIDIPVDMLVANEVTDFMDNSIFKPIFTIWKPIRYGIYTRDSVPPIRPRIRTIALVIPVPFEMVRFTISTIIVPLGKSGSISGGSFVKHYVEVC